MQAGTQNGDHTPSYTEQVVIVKRCARATHGGPRFTYSALVVVGDRCGRVGIALGKSSEVAGAIRKATESAASHLFEVRLSARTIPHQVSGSYCGARVLLMPAAVGTGLIAARPVRAVLECVGLKDVISKSLGAKNSANVAKATLRALMALRLREESLRERGLEAGKKRIPFILKLPELPAGESEAYWN